ncbi:MAG: hydrogenase expression/formation protein HypE [Desulfobacca sp.]|uniref:hydrogenase expression/formation protein HypE n=1 Tax=Desulfobacca sp. TaxID=2067990 RepID=UPI00404B19CA
MSRILLSHGAGGRDMLRLIDEVFRSQYGLAGGSQDDSAVLSLQAADLALTTDAFVVSPLFFPGGDIGRLAVAGTVNDLLTAAAQPVALAAAFILEEGFGLADLERIVASMQQTANEAGVSIVTGDTKVVPRGSADQVFITTTGLGRVLRPGVSGAGARPGDAVLLTGSVGEHGTAVMLAREQLLASAPIVSDAAPLTEIVLNLIEAGVELHALRDPTRGGLAATLNEIAGQSQVAIEIEEGQVPLRPAVAAACEALGLDPFTVANEGKMVIIVPPAATDQALAIIRQSRYGEEAAAIGTVLAGPSGRVQVRTIFGTARLLEMPAGELLPRIC